MAKASQNPEDADLIPVIQEILADAEDEGRRRPEFTMPFPPMPKGKGGKGGFAGGFAEFMENLGKMDFDFDFGDEPEPSPGKRSPKRK